MRDCLTFVSTLRFVHRKLQLIGHCAGAIGDSKFGSRGRQSSLLERLSSCLALAISDHGGCSAGVVAGDGTLKSAVSRQAAQNPPQRPLWKYLNLRARESVASPPNNRCFWALNDSCRYKFTFTGPTGLRSLCLFFFDCLVRFRLSLSSCFSRRARQAHELVLSLFSG
jgi:hypothetical protein